MCNSTTNLGLSEDDISVGRGRLVHIRFGDDEENVFRFPDGDPVDVGDRLQTQFAHRLSRLFLRTRLFGFRDGFLLDMGG